MTDFFQLQQELFTTWKGYDILDDDILLVDFMTQEQCERLIEIADNHGGWGSVWNMISFQHKK